MLTVAVRSLGAGRKEPEWSTAVPLPPQSDGSLTLRGLIEHVVAHQVAAFRERQAGRKLLEVLSPTQIAVGAAQGRIVPGGQELEQEVREGPAIAAALQAFEDGLYLVLLDGTELKALDQAVTLRTDSRLHFLRLTLLAGG